MATASIVSIFRSAVSQLRKKLMPISPLRQRRDVDAAAERAAGAADDDDAQGRHAEQIVDERVEVARPLFVGAVEHLPGG